VLGYTKAAFWLVESTTPSFWKSHCQLVGWPADVSVKITRLPVCTCAVKDASTAPTVR
jgi:hypothetical protein